MPFRLAEGAIQIAMEEMPILFMEAMHNLGFGRIGKILAKCSMELEARVCRGQKIFRPGLDESYGYKPVS